MPLPRPGISRERVTLLTPREEQLVALLREQPRTAGELAEAFGTSVPTMRTGLSRLAKKVSVVAQFRYGRTRYALMEEPLAAEG